VLCLDLLENAAKKRAEETAKAEESKTADDSFVAWIEEQIAARRDAKAAKNYAEADRIRAELLGKGVTLIDTKEGTTYRIGDAT
jgi:cysteinyl-tRNA synthetase